jgi:alcohol dehydrogenase (NADP+)
MAATTWADAYLVSPTSTGGAPPTTTRSLSSRRPVVFDFSTIDADSIPDEVWEEVQRSEREEIEKRDAFLKECEQSMYEAGRRLAAKMPSVTLRNGSRMPLIGLGTWKAERGEVKRAVEYAVRAGYRHIDCASVYQNEDEVGDAIGYVLERGLVEREELFVCSKVWNTDHAAARVRKACEASLKALKVDYLDLYLIHWPVTGNVGDEVSPSVRETWEAMESLVRDGLVRSIGTSNFSAKKLADIASYATVQPSVCQVEVHPYHRNDALLSFCADRGIHVTAFSPLGSPDSESIFPRAVPDAVLMRDPRVLRVAERTGKNVGQVLIRWALQHGTSVIPKSTNPSRIAGNLDVLDWELSASDYALLSSMAFQMRMVNGGMWLNPRGPYRTMEDLWDEPDVLTTTDVLEGLSTERLYFSPDTDTPADFAGAGNVAERVPTATLSSGYKIPLIGLGTWKAEKGQVRDAVYSSLKAGYRHIDCASVYQNEDEVGDAIGYVLERGLVEREELFVCSKVWNTDHAAARVRKACEASLKALKVDYLDLYLIHWPVTGNVGDEVSPSVRETWEAMESLVRDGLVRSIGTSNFSAKKLADIASYATVQPSVCQVEVHPYHRNDALLSFCADRGIHVTAFSPLGSPDSESIFPRAVPDAVLMRDPRVLRVAERTGKNVGQVLIRWALQHGTSVIPKSTNPSRIAGNLDVLDWELSASDYALLSSMAFQMRMVNGGMWLNPRGPYRTMEDLWDEPETEMTSEAFERDLAAATATATDASEGGTAGNTDETTTAPAPQLFSPKGRAKSEARSESNSESHTTDNAARRLSHPIALSPANSSEGSENDYHSVTESPAVPSLTEKVASFSKWMGFSR